MLSSSGNVVGYNYINNNIKPTGYETWMLAFPIINHGAHPVENLWESNVGGKSEADITHGSSSHNVLYRCRSTVRMPLRGVATMPCTLWILLRGINIILQSDVYSALWISVLIRFPPLLVLCVANIIFGHVGSTKC